MTTASGVRVNTLVRRPLAVRRSVRVDAPSIVGAAVAGVPATYLMDLAGRRIVAPALGKGPSGNLGRWIGHMFPRPVHARGHHEVGAGRARSRDRYGGALRDWLRTWRWVRAATASPALPGELVVPRCRIRRSDDCVSVVLDVPRSRPGHHGASRPRCARARVRAWHTRRIRLGPRGCIASSGVAAPEPLRPVVKGGRGLGR